MVNIRSIRASGCSLPIEIAYAGSIDITPSFHAVLQAFGVEYDVTLRDLSQSMDIVSEFSNGAAHLPVGASWAMKPFAALLSGFTEVMVQDSDLVWFGNPDDVFREPTYEKSGTVFYYDRRTVTIPSNETVMFARSVLPSDFRRQLPAHLLTNQVLTGLSAHYQESGVVVIDKSRPHNLAGLIATCKLNSKVERFVVYERVYGDKETFWMGWEMAGSSGMYGFSRWPAAHIGILVRGDQDSSKAIAEGLFVTDPNRADHHPHLRICSAQLAHLDPSGKRLLWLNGGPLRSKRGSGIPRLFEPTHWGMERYSKWDLGGDNQACLWLKRGTSMTVDDDGKWWMGTVNTTSAQRGSLGATDLFDTSGDPSKPHHGRIIEYAHKRTQLPPYFSGDFGYAVPRVLNKLERQTMRMMTEWWADARERTKDVDPVREFLNSINTDSAGVPENPQIDLQIQPDPIKARAEAEAAAYRKMEAARAVKAALGGLLAVDRTGIERVPL
ncbi:hypothetical protein HDU93_006603 [Gonapodya sp. JEL0774]|nr:hypothetical protein HDU93_006603 [Gonapodya sp. JEL0774]